MQLWSCFVCQFAISFHAFRLHDFHVIGTMRKCSRQVFPEQGTFSFCSCTDSGFKHEELPEDLFIGNEFVRKVVIMYRIPSFQYDDNK